MIAESPTASFCDTTAPSFDWCCNCSVSDSYYIREQREAEAVAKAAHAREMRCRNLGYLYRDEMPKLIHIRKPVLIRFQPRWSSRRWRSVT
jgi:hypothetical protein